ncbi:MAG: ECF transporter S component [Eubacteriales bacterium]
MEKDKNSIRKMTETAIFAAIIILMAFTPIGYLRIGPLSITFIPIPVAVGAIAVGPAAGAILGAVFGLTSFLQCFGMDAFGTALLAVNPIYMFIVCMLPRVLCGLIPGLIFRAFPKEKRNVFTYSLSSFSCAALNTILFVSLLILCFYGSGSLSVLGDTVIDIILYLVTANALIEAAVCMVVGVAVSKSLLPMIEKRF